VSEYANVTEQSSIRAGDGGFNVNVAGNTTLKGGAITSTQKALDTKSNSFISSGTVSLINAENDAHFQADSVAISAGMTGAGEVAQPLNSVGIGSKSGKVNNTTLAAITGVAGKLHARTGDTQTDLSKIFDASSVKADVQSQVTITSEFGKQASKAVGDYADSRLRDAIAQDNQANIDDWKEELKLQASAYDATKAQISNAIWTAKGRLKVKNLGGHHDKVAWLNQDVMTKMASEAAYKFNN
jgi:filamentous hemagglutinin